MQLLEFLVSLRWIAINRVSDISVHYAQALSAVVFLISTQVPLAIAHPVWSRFWSFEVIILACAKIWEVSWKPPMDCDTQTIKLSGIVVLFPYFLGKIGLFLPICCFDTGLLRLFLAYGWYAAVGKVVNFEMYLLRCAVVFLISTQVPLAIAHPVWSRFWSFEVIILACTKIWEVS